MTLATIFQKQVRISKIRAGRRQPGLRPQHLQAVLLASELCGGVVRGASVGSTEIEYAPGNKLEPFKQTVDVGSAGSLSLILQTIIPIATFRNQELDLRLIGGTEVPNSPTVDYLEKIVLPVYEKLGARISLATQRRGYYPKGGGVVVLKCSKEFDAVPLIFPEPVRENPKIKILSVSRALPDHVPRRQADIAKNILSNSGFSLVNVTLDFAGESSSPGSSMLIYARTEARLIGASSLGERGKRAEIVGEEAALQFVKEIANFPNVDSHLADMLITVLCCISGKSIFRASIITDHFRTNAEVATKLSGCQIEILKESLFRIEIQGRSPEKAN
jgi:RNA 3'-terminal phosphate cyclase (ATP)